MHSFATETLSHRDASDTAVGETTLQQITSKFTKTMRPLSQISEASEDMDPMDFNDRVKALVFILNDIRQQYTTKRGPFGRLSESMKKLSETASFSFKPDPRQVVADVGNCLMAVDTAMSKLKNCNSATLASAEVQAMSAFDSLDRCSPAVAKALSGVTVVVSKMRFEVRSKYMADRHMVLKLAEFLVRGGYSANLSKTLAPLLENVDKVRRVEADGQEGKQDVEDLVHRARAQHHSNVTYMQTLNPSSADDIGHDLSKVFLDYSGGPLKKFQERYFEKFGENVRVKVQKNNEQMSREENAKWKGCHRAAQAEIPPEFSWSPILKPDQADSAAAGGYLSTLKNGANRIKWALFSSMAQIIVPLSAGISVMIVPIEPVLSGGVLISDFEAFLGSVSGQSLIGEQSLLVHLREDSVLFVPFGYFAWSIHFDMSKEGAQPWGHIWTLPLLGEQYQAHTSASCVGAILEYNIQYLKAQANGFYTSRGEMIQAFKEGLCAH